MLNKKILLGSLVAGTFLLPMTANAGLVKGQCYNCHTMHQTDGLDNAIDADSQDRSSVTNTLLFGDGCAGCHATTNGNGPNGRETGGTIHAPQVDDAATPNLAGYFINGPAGETQHNITSSMTNMDAPLYAAPGGTSTNASCEGCHDQTGGHHGTSDTYRMLYPNVAGTSADWDFGNSGAATPDSSGTTYSSAGMNGKCASCHGTFHTGQGSLAGGWVRHPTDVSLARMDTATAAGYNYVANYTGNESTIPLGYDGTDSDVIMCITCHFSHGGPNPDLLRWSGYGKGGANNRAGDNVVSFGCESCHDYGQGM